MPEIGRLFNPAIEVTGELLEGLVIQLTHCILPRVLRV